MRGLYAICDLDVLGRCGADPLQYTAALAAAGPCAIQLRAKQLAARDTVALLRAMRPLCAAGTLLFANDRPDLAWIAGCDGVHVGQTDLAVAEVRRVAPRLRVGVSTHSAGQLEAALAERPDYVAFGPVFATTSKRDSDPVVGLEALKMASSRAATYGIPLVAIGGIRLEHAASLAAWVDAVAIISGLLPEDAPLDLSRVTARARELQATLTKPRGLRGG